MTNATTFKRLVDFFAGHMHQTKYGDQMSSLRLISASIIQGSAIGLASYVVNTSDLHAITDDNELCKYADDTYIIIPVSYTHLTLPTILRV